MLNDNLYKQDVARSQTRRAPVRIAMLLFHGSLLLSLRAVWNFGLCVGQSLRQRFLGEAPEHLKRFTLSSSSQLSFLHCEILL